MYLHWTCIRIESKVRTAHNVKKNASKLKDKKTAKSRGLSELVKNLLKVTQASKHCISVPKQRNSGSSVHKNGYKVQWAQSRSIYNWLDRKKPVSSTDSHTSLSPSEENSKIFKCWLDNTLNQILTDQSRHSKLVFNSTASEQITFTYRDILPNAF